MLPPSLARDCRRVVELSRLLTHPLILASPALRARAADVAGEVIIAFGAHDPQPTPGFAKGILALHNGTIFSCPVVQKFVSLCRRPSRYVLVNAA
jgi:hypothetical protein